MTTTPTTAEVVSNAMLRATPEQVKADVEALSALMHAALIEGQHYGTIPGTPRPTLYKAGAEWLLKWAGYGHTLTVAETDRDTEGRKAGVTYRCTVHLLHDAGAIVASCDGYCGYDEPDREAHRNRWGRDVPRSPWNTIIKMAQKRALVGAALQACGASGLFTQDMEDHPGTADAPADPWVELGWTDKAAFDAALAALVERMKVAAGDDWETIAADVKVRRDELKAKRGATAGWPVSQDEYQLLVAYVAELGGTSEAADPEVAKAGDEEAEAQDDAGEVICSGCGLPIAPDASRLTDSASGQVWCEVCMDDPEPDTGS
jgi:hypothetical protein